MVGENKSAVMAEEKYPIRKIILHPLLIFPVVETVFENLDVESLKSCRLVCYLWDYEAFRIIRKKGSVNISTYLRQELFLNSDLAEIFRKFSLKAYKWNQQLANYCFLNKPSGLEVAVELTFNEKGEEDGFEMFQNLLKSHAGILVALRVHESWNSTGSRNSRLVKYIDTKCLGGFFQLKKLAVVCGRTDPSALLNLWLSMIRTAPRLTALDFRNFSCENFWESVTSEPIFWKLSELRYVHDRRTAVLAMNHHLLQRGLPVNSLKRFCIPFQDSQSGTICNMLSKVADTLEVLEFYTQDETALSPIDFPVMRRLKVLDAGSSQFSFPTLVPEKFPELTEIRATYWDWVYSREDLPDVHYYWRAGIPHDKVTDIQIRFPNWAFLELQYRKLENFDDFVEILHSKFPSACNFTFHNVSPCNEVKRGLEAFANAFEFTFKSFRIASYCTAEELGSCPIEIDVTEEESRQRELEVLDLCSEDWPDVWSKQRKLLSKMRFDWLPNLLYYDKLKVLKVLWVKNLFSKLHLMNEYALPELQHLEFVGNICVNRLERAAVQRLRPNLTIIQHKTCFCDKEDWWYMNDNENGKVFINMFAENSRSVTWYIKKVLFKNLLR